MPKVLFSAVAKRCHLSVALAEDNDLLLDAPVEDLRIAARLIARAMARFDESRFLNAGKVEALLQLEAAGCAICDEMRRRSMPPRG